LPIRTALAEDWDFGDGLMSENPPEDEFDSPAPLLFPKSVLIAGIMWIIFGGSIFLFAGLGYSMERPGSPMPLSMWGFIFGAASVYFGIHTVRGTAKGMSGNGIGSIAFAVLTFGIAVNHFFIAVSAFASKDADKLVGGILLAGATTFVGAGFLAAGILALVGHQNYKTWQKTQKCASSSNQLSP